MENLHQKKAYNVLWDREQGLLYIDAKKGAKDDFYIFPISSIRYLRVGRKVAGELMGEVEMPELGQEEKKVKTPISPKRAPIRTGSAPK